jgi:NTE family protein
MPEMASDARSNLAVVLSGGGARAAYQVGVLAAIAERLPHLAIPIITGVSAGAINAAFLGAHRGALGHAVRELQGQWLRLTSDRVYRLPAGSVAKTVVRVGVTFLRRRRAPAVRGVLDMRPLAHFLREVIDFSGIADNIAAGRLKAVALSATSYETGTTVSFVQSRADLLLWRRARRLAIRSDLTISHVLASSAIPLIFPAVKLDRSFYGDGSVRQTAPLAPAIHLGAQRIVAIGMRGLQQPEPRPPSSGEYPTPAQVAGLLLDSVFLDALDADVERLERINRLLDSLAPGRSAPDGLRPIRMFWIRPSRDLGAMARGYLPRLPKLMDWVVHGIGGREERGADLLSYLLFEPEYTGLLMELGHEDALGRWDELERLLQSE